MASNSNKHQASLDNNDDESHKVGFGSLKIQWSVDLDCRTATDFVLGREKRKRK